MPYRNEGRRVAGWMDVPDEHIVGYVVQVSPELEPGSSSRDVIGGAFAAHLNKYRHIDEVVAIPTREGREGLEAITCW